MDNQFNNGNQKSNDGKGFSIAGLICGIIGAVFAWWGWFSYIALACAIIGIVFGVKGRQMSSAVYGKPSGIATAGLVIGIIGTCLAGIAVIACTLCAACVGNTIGFGALVS